MRNGEYTTQQEKKSYFSNCFKIGSELSKYGSKLGEKPNLVNHSITASSTNLL